MTTAFAELSKQNLIILNNYKRTKLRDKTQWTMPENELVLSGQITLSPKECFSLILNKKLSATEKQTPSSFQDKVGWVHFHLKAQCACVVPITLRLSIWESESEPPVGGAGGEQPLYVLK